MGSARWSSNRGVNIPAIHFVRLRFTRLIYVLRARSTRLPPVPVSSYRRVRWGLGSRLHSRRFQRGMHVCVVTGVP